MGHGITFKGLVGALVVAVVFLVPAGLWLSGCPLPGSDRRPLPPPLSIIQGMSELASARIIVESPLQASNGDFKGTWRVSGHVTYSIDLQQVVYESTDAEERTAVIRLPAPHILDSYADPDHSFELSMEWNTWIPLSSSKALRDEFWHEANQLVRRIGSDAGHAVQARAKAETALKNLFAGLGWQVTLKWQDAPKS